MKISKIDGTKVIQNTPNINNDSELDFQPMDMTVFESEDENELVVEDSNKELSEEEQVELERQEEIKAANITTKLVGKRLHVEFEMADGIVVHMQSPLSNDFSKIQQYAKKYPEATELDITFAWVILLCTKWGTNPKVTRQELGELDEYDLFRIAGGLEKALDRKLRRPRR